MSTEQIIELIFLVLSTLGLIAVIVVSLIKGDMQKFIKEKMVEAEQSGLDGVKKLQFVIDAVKDKYKILQIIVNVQKFVNDLVALTKKINYEEKDKK